MFPLEHTLEVLALSVVLIAGLSVTGAIVTARLLRARHLRWTWAAFGIPLALLVMGSSVMIGISLGFASVLACWLGAHWHRLDLNQGADIAEIARTRLSPLAVVKRAYQRRRIGRQGWIRDGRLVIGEDEQGLPVRIPVGYESGSHALVAGATGSGKTVSEAWIAGRLIEQGHGAIVIDPKGDPLLRSELHRAAQQREARFFEWTPQGPCVYNPYAHGSDSEIADKALAGEQFTEPHYLRQAQRYLGHAVRALQAAGVSVSPVSLMEHLDPLALEVSARQLPETEATSLLRYLDGLGDRQRRELAGVRDRLSILCESDINPWIGTSSDGTGGDQLDLSQAIQDRAVVYFRLDADRRPLVSQMLAGAIVSDLVTLVGGLQGQPVPTVVLIDEFSAIAAGQVARLFARARSAGINLILSTQELADLTTAGGTGEGVLQAQVLANVETVIAHRQGVPESAELIAAMAGTRPAWVSTEQTEQALLGAGPSGRGSRRRGYEFQIHPSQIKTLPTGWAAVLTPGTGPKPTITRIYHPSQAHK
ncbi:MAG TPA: TraM recognition domain-containing protein [Solirubrobacteraceae bacterium]|nr:TraM recognition domain-containing protein [Solirubrobacteraceae bacterium]